MENQNGSTDTIERSPIRDGSGNDVPADGGQVQEVEANAGNSDGSAGGDNTGVPGGVDGNGNVEQGLALDALMMENAKLRAILGTYDSNMNIEDELGYVGGLTIESGKVSGEAKYRRARPIMQSTQGTVQAPIQTEEQLQAESMARLKRVLGY